MGTSKLYRLWSDEYGGCKTFGPGSIGRKFDKLHSHRKFRRYAYETIERGLAEYLEDVYEADTGDTEYEYE